MPTPVRALPTPLQTRRAEICRTAAQIFQDRGFDGTSMSDLARALGMTKAGLYHYFDGKEALLFEIVTFGLDRVRDEVVLPAKAIRDPGERLEQIILRHARIVTNGRGAITHLNDEIRALPSTARRQVEERMRHYVELIRTTMVELKSAGRLRDIDPVVATFSLLGMILWLPRWFRQDGRLSQEQVAKEMTGFVLGGLLRPRAVRSAKRPKKFKSK